MKASSEKKKIQTYIILSRLNVSSSCLSTLKNYLQKFSADRKIPPLACSSEETLRERRSKKANNFVKATIVMNRFSKAKYSAPGED